MRKPIVEAMLSYTTRQHGRGWVYAVQDAHKGGRTVGSVLVAVVLLLNEEYRIAYALLAISALLALASLTIARIQFPVPSRLEEHHCAEVQGFSAAYWLYMLAGACFASGLMSFELIAYHLSSSGLVSQNWVPLFLAFATGLGVVVSLALGKLYDRIGFPVILAAVLLTSLFSPFVFFGRVYLALFGMALWESVRLCRTCCSRPLSLASCQRGDEILHSGCSMQDTGAVGSSAALRPDCSMSTRVSAWLCSQ
jgi:hypothetical protein